MNFYNEWDAGAAAWLRELIKAGLIPPGIVDERSISEITPGDLAGFTQCHFFCGIGGWPLALHMAGVRSDQQLWTGSPPCQPFSVAGKQLGQLDERHLAPTFMRLVAQCRPPVLFGEQVAAAIGKHWLDDLFTELERQGYACGAAVLPACSVGAPHKRDRLFFGAHRLANTGSFCDNQRREDRALQGRQNEAEQSRMGRSVMRMADALYEQWDGSGDIGQGRRTELANICGGSSMAKPHSEQQRQIAESGERNEHAPPKRNEDPAAVTGLCSDNSTNPHHSFWSDADWLGCRDGKFRPVEPGTFPLVDGFPNRVAALRGAGNAIVPQVAAEFIEAFHGAIADCREGCCDN